MFTLVKYCEQKVIGLYLFEDIVGLEVLWDVSYAYHGINFNLYVFHLYEVHEKLDET